MSSSPKLSKLPPKYFVSPKAFLLIHYYCWSRSDLCHLFLNPGLPTKFSLTTLTAEHWFWNGTLAISFCFSAAHSSVTHHFQNWTVLHSVAHMAAALSLQLFSKKTHSFFPYPKSCYSYCFFCLDVFPLFIT